MRPLMVDRNLGNSAMALLDAAADRAEDDAQRRAEDQVAHECRALAWLMSAADPQILGDELDRAGWDACLQILLDTLRSQPAPESQSLRARITDLLMPAALEATREPR